MNAPSAVTPARRPADGPHPPALAASVEAALCTGGPTAAIGVCEAAIERQPDDAAAHRHLGVLLAGLRQRPAAVQAAKRACELAADDPRGLSDLGRVHALLGSIEEAAACFRKAVVLDDRHADGWHNLGTALARLGRREPAFTALKNALLLEPARADSYLELGNLLIDAARFEDALECFERAAAYDPTLARARSRLAGYFSGRGKVDRAQSLFRQSLGLDPDHLAGWMGLGRTLEDLGDGEGALGCYRNVLARAPSHAAALGHYLALLPVEAPSALLTSTQAAMAGSNVSDEPRALIAYGLAKYYDRRCEYAEAAAAGLAANAARRRATGGLDRAALASRVDAVIGEYDAEFFANRHNFGIGTDQPVFIVGLPRSGTTLTEQIIAAHPLVHGAGEMQDLARLSARAASQHSDPPWRGAAVIDAAESRALAYRYLRALRDGAPRGRLRISDKAPLNFFQLALAAVLFPNASVIHCRRNRRDNALSIWMENFNVEQHYATDFGDLEFYAAQHDRLIAHWRAVLPLRMLEVHYEDTVAGLEQQARRIVEFLRVPWDARCLRFHDADRAVQTPSRWQVRQPIYTRSVGRWCKYAAFLPDLLEAFGDYGEAE